MKTKNILIEQLKGEREFNPKMNMTDAQINDLAQDVEDELSWKMEKKYIDNSRFMEFIHEMATQLTEMNYGADTFVYSEDEPRFSEEAQDFFNETYDEYETMANNIMGVYKHSDMIMHIYPTKKNK